ncbi:MAG: hypothetical protein Q8J64_06295 [Thermodesulfovibrionales bacterium]|nr:hypothetical protein [Thermodesulfovibrionales bacterium]
MAGAKKHKKEIETKKEKEPVQTEAETKHDSRRRLLNIVLKVLLPILFFSYLMGVSFNFPLNDPDIWWHLKTGQYILSSDWKVPEEDPFAYTTPVPLDDSKKIGLRSQWLGQVIFYLSFAAAGYPGVGILRNILIILPMAALYIWLLRRGLKPWWTAVIIVSPAALMLPLQLFYSFERPQGISFCLAIFIVMLIERLRSHGREGHLKENPKPFDFSYAALPLLTAAWSNIHAGFIIGNVIIIAYAGAEALRVGYRALMGRRKDAPYLKWFFAVAALSVVASFLNPNGYVIFFDYVTGLSSMFFESVASSATGGGSGWVQNVVLEYKSLWYFYTNLDYKWLIAYWVFIGVLYVLLILKYWRQRDIDIAELAVVSLVTFFANYYARGLMVSLVVLSFYMGKTLTELSMPELRWRNLFRAGVAAVLMISIGFYTYSYKRMPYALKPGITQTWVTPWYPVRLVQFLSVTDIKGPMYNFYTWGGFLIWSLYPKYEVFIDGRALDEAVNRTADSILKTFPPWESQLDAYGINFIVIPVIFRESGHIIPLAATLARHDGWNLVFLKHNSAVFVRNVPQNEKIIYSFNINKDEIFYEIIGVEDIFISSAPWNPVYTIAKAEALMMLGRYEEARTLYERFPSEGAHGLQQLRESGH